MTEQDIETRRARDLERYHRRTARRRAKGLCLKCGKRPPAPHRSQCEPCAEKRRPADRARHHRRSAERAAQGLCPKCGKRPLAPDRTMCGPCGAKRNRASRARDARLRAAGMPRRDPERAKLYERERSRRKAEERRAAGLCVRCGKAPADSGRTVCGPCGETRRTSERARYAKAKAEGKLYGGRKVETKRRIGRERSRKRDEARRAAGLCTECGKHPPADGGASCESCRAARRAAERALYAARRDYASYYTSVVLIVAGLGYRRSPREPSHPRLFCRRRVGDFKQAVAGVAIDVSAQEPGLAPSVDRGARHPESLCDLVAPQQPVIAQPLIARL